MSKTFCHLVEIKIGIHRQDSWRQIFRRSSTNVTSDHIEWKLLKSPLGMQIKTVTVLDKDSWRLTLRKSSPLSDENVSTDTTGSCSSAVNLTKMNMADLLGQFWTNISWVANFLECSAVYCDLQSLKISTIVTKYCSYFPADKQWNCSIKDTQNKGHLWGHCL